jgi:hypothetical protein
MPGDPASRPLTGLDHCGCVPMVRCARSERARWALGNFQNKNFADVERWPLLPFGARTARTFTLPPPGYCGPTLCASHASQVNSHQRWKFNGGHLSWVCHQWWNSFRGLLGLPPSWVLPRGRGGAGNSRPGAGLHAAQPGGVVVVSLLAAMPYGSCAGAARWINREGVGKSQVAAFVERRGVPDSH